MRARQLWSPPTARVLIMGLLFTATSGIAHGQAEVDLDGITEQLQRAVGDALRGLVEPPLNDTDRARRRAAALAEAKAEADKKRQQARQMEQLLQPLVRTELEMVRLACGDLPPESRRQILTAAERAAATVAGEWVARQGRDATRPLDVRARLHELIKAAVEQHVGTIRYAAYRREQEARDGRRGAAARIRIVSKLDDQLELTGRQREAILADLAGRWNPSWLRELDDAGGAVINGYRPAPDYAAECIEPHLDARQREEWRSWIRSAGSRQMQFGTRIRFDGQGLPENDPWWGP
jgi:broad specificity phosphatase PhoE